MWFPQLIFLLVLYTFGPGLLLVRPLRLAPGERLVAAVGVGLFLDFLLGFGIYAAGLTSAAHVLITAVCLVLAVVAWRDWVALLRSQQVRRLLVAWATLFVWGMVLLSMIRHYGGGTWGGDWVEHYQRSLFFEGGVPLDFKFIGLYPLPMRPPMMNVLTVSLLTQTVGGEQLLEAFQVVFVFLNSLVYLPLALVVPRLVRLPARLARKVPWTLAAVLAASPMFDQNLTYAWTKLLAAFYAVAAITVYMRGWRRAAGTAAGTAAASAPSPGTPGEGWGGGLRNGTNDREDVTPVSERTREDLRSADPDGVRAPNRTSVPSGSSRGTAQTPASATTASPTSTTGPLPNPPPGYRGRGKTAAVLQYAHAPDPALRQPWRRPPTAARFVLAFSLLCAGFLVHFSVGPYALFLGLHYLFAVWWRRPNKLVEAAAIGGVSAAVLAAWFAWSVLHYGPKTTFTSTSAVSDAVVMTPAENVANIARNLGNTLLPTIVRSPELLWSTDLEQTGVPGQVRDFAFLVYQVSLPGGLGSVGCVLAVYLLWRAARGRDPVAKPVRRFWLAFVPLIYVVGTSVYGGVDRFGVAHICLQPMVLLGLGLVAGGIWLVPVRWRSALLVGLLLDFAVGVLLHMSLQHHLFEIRPIYRPDPATGQAYIYAYDVPVAPNVPSRAAQNNLKNKYEQGTRPGEPKPFWGDRFGDLLPVLQFAAGGMLAFFLFKGLIGPTHRRATAVPAGGFPVVPRTSRGTPRNPPALKRRTRASRK